MKHKILKHLKSTPKTFNCQHCQILLTVAIDFNTNLPYKHLICPKCNLMTKVPQSIIENKMKSSFNKIQQLSKQAYNNLSNHQTIKCKQCNNLLDTTTNDVIQCKNV